MCSTSASTTQKTFPELKEIDSLLRCGICYEYMKNTLVTTCSHNYCSYCIRKFMQYKTQCPTCFKETAEPQLRNNRLIDQLIVLFLKVSDKIEDLAAQKDWYIVDTSKSCDENDKSLLHKSVESDIRRDVSDIRRDVSSHNESPSTSTPRVKIQVPDMFTPKRKIKIRPAIDELVPTVPCPVCNVDIPERNINVHLDACLAKSKVVPESSTPIPRRKPLPKLVYPLLQEKDLRRKLKEVGLNTQGDRKTLVSRHQRFTVLYNSECDSLNPRSVSEILEQVAQEEKLEKKVVSGGNVPIISKTWLSVDKKSDPNSIEEAQKKYLKDNQACFSALIEKVKNQRKPSAPQKDKEDPEPSTSKTPESARKETHNKILDEDEDIPDNPPDSPEICCIAEIEPNAAARNLHSSFDLFDHSNTSPAAKKPNGLKSLDENSKLLSPLRAARPLQRPPCTPPGPSGSTKSPVTSPRTSEVSPNRPFSPNFCVRPLSDGERTPSPPPVPQSPRSPVFPTKRALLSSKSPDAPSMLNNPDDFGDWLEVVLEDNLPKRRKRSLRTNPLSEDTGRGRTLRKRPRK